MSKISYTILVTGPAYGTQNASTAFLFCKSLIKSNHILNSIFFYCDGVYNANNMNTPAIDEFNLLKSWQDLHVKYHVQLYVCASAALRRGVLEDENQSLYKRKGNLGLYFQMSGLIEWAAAIKSSDRLIQF